MFPDPGDCKLNSWGIWFKMGDGMVYGHSVLISYAALIGIGIVILHADLHRGDSHDFPPWNQDDYVISG